MNRVVGRSKGTLREGRKMPIDAKGQGRLDLYWSTKTFSQLSDLM